MKKFLPYILILIVVVGSFARVNSAEAVNAKPCTSPGVPAGCTEYYLLAPIPCKRGTTGCVLDKDGKNYVLEKFDTGTDPATGQNKALGSYLNMMIKIFIGLCAVLAVVMIVIGGLEYMTSELISSKEAGKNRITGALLGLIIALGAYALLYTINPDLLNSDINAEPAGTKPATVQPVENPAANIPFDQPKTNIPPGSVQGNP